MNPKQRANPPFNSDQIEYALNDERGLLTTWDMYKKYKLIENGIFTKEKVRQAFFKKGLLDLTPTNLFKIGIVKEYFKKPRACILDIINAKLCVGDEILCNKDDIWLNGKIESIQKDDKTIDNVQNGEIGLVLDIELAEGFTLYKRLE